MDEIESMFNEMFAPWKIRLPVDALREQHRGQIVAAGWAIWVLLGSDENGAYLDYYASHRMTNDRHGRIHASGAHESLPAIQSFRVCATDPEEDARRKREFLARNQEVSRTLTEKGFGVTGHEPGGVLINRYLHLNPDES